MIQLYLRDFAEADKRVAARLDNQVAQLLHVVETADRTQQVAPFSGVDFSARYVLVTPPDRVTNGGYRKAAIRQPCRVEDDTNLPLRAAAYLYVGYTGNVGHARADVVFDEVPHHVHVEFARVARQRRDVKVHERIGRKRARENPRFIDVDRVRRHLVQGVIDADEGLGYIDTEREVELDRCRSAGRGCFEPLQVGYGAQVFLLLDQDLFLDILRRRAGPGGAH